VWDLLPREATVIIYRRTSAASKVLHDERGYPQSRGPSTVNKDWIGETYALRRSLGNLKSRL